MSADVSTPFGSCDSSVKSLPPTPLSALLSACGLAELCLGCKILYKWAGEQGHPCLFLGEMGAAQLGPIALELLPVWGCEDSPLDRVKRSALFEGMGLRSGPAFSLKHHVAELQ